MHTEVSKEETKLNCHKSNAYCDKRTDKGYRWTFSLDAPNAFRLRALLLQLLIETYVSMRQPNIY